MGNNSIKFCCKVNCTPKDRGVRYSKECFPKVNIRLYKSEKELKELKEKYTQLETAYNELKNSIEVKDSE